MSSCPKANIVTVPRCLRHTSQDLIYTDIMAITVFLKTAISGVVKSSEFECLGKDEADFLHIGFDRCFDLLQDKIDILSNEQNWPLCDLVSKITLAESLQEVEKSNSEQ